MHIRPMQKLSERLSARMEKTDQGAQFSRKDQYELLLRYYTEESERYEALNKRAAAYLSIVGAVSAFAAFKTEIATYSLRSPVVTALAIAALLALLACVLAVAFSMRITAYRSPVSPKQLVLAVDAENYTSNDTYSVMLAGLVNSTEWNRGQNDQRAFALQLSLWFAAVAVVLAIAINVTILYQPQKETPMSTSNQSSGTSSPAPATSQPSKTPMSDLLNNTQTVPLKKSDDAPSKPLLRPKG